MPVILLEENLFEYTLRLSSRNRHVRISVRAGGAVTVSAPRYVNRKTVEDFLRAKSKWVVEKVEHFKKWSLLNPIAPVSGAKNKKEKYQEYQEYKARALQIAEEKLQKFNKYYGFKYTKVGIKNQKTRWGSCSRKGNLNFNYKIALLPGHLADYLVVHELCHLGEFNHSSRFWDLVSHVIPNWRIARAELKKWAV